MFSGISVVSALRRNLAEAICHGESIDNNLKWSLQQTEEFIHVLKRIGLLKSDLADSLDAHLKKCKPSIPSEFADLQEKLQYVSTLRDGILSNLNLPSWLKEWVTNDAKIIHDYLYGLTLLVECRNAALAVSEQRWQEIACHLMQ